jgi:hypothetical protein
MPPDFGAHVEFSFRFESDKVFDRVRDEALKMSKTPSLSHRMGEGARQGG